MPPVLSPRPREWSRRWLRTRGREHGGHRAPDTVREPEPRCLRLTVRGGTPEPAAKGLASSLRKAFCRLLEGISEQEPCLLFTCQTSLRLAEDT